MHRLGIEEEGTFVFRGKARKYGHILPKPLAWLNIPEPFRKEVREFVERDDRITLHKYFHHLNSSQALAFALFYPYWVRSVRTLSCASVSGPPVSTWWDFERIPEPDEGTNVDGLVDVEGRNEHLSRSEASERERRGVGTSVIRIAARTYAPILTGVGASPCGTNA